MFPQISALSIAPVSRDVSNDEIAFWECCSSVVNWAKQIELRVLLAGFFSQYKSISLLRGSMMRNLFSPSEANFFISIKTGLFFDDIFSNISPLIITTRTTAGRFTFGEVRKERTKYPDL